MCCAQSLRVAGLAHLDSDPSLALHLQLVHGLGLLDSSHSTRLQQPISQGALPMIDVRYDAEVPYPVLREDVRDEWNVCSAVLAAGVLGS